MRFQLSRTVIANLIGAVLAILVLSAFVIFSPDRSLSKSEIELSKMLADRGNSRDRVEALDIVLKAPDKHSALVLLFCVPVAWDQNRLEDAAFLFYIGKLRVQFDRECFPPRGTGGDSPFVLANTLSVQMGMGLNPKIMAEPKTFAKVIDRVEAWSPKAPKDFVPPYEFTERRTEEAALEVTKAGRMEYCKYMKGLAELLNDSEYFSAFRIVQKYNLEVDHDRPTEAERDAAMEVIKKIEKKKGIKGVSKDEG